MKTLCKHLVTLLLLMLAACLLTTAALADDLSKVKVGDIITFGKYEQDNKTANGKEPIEWIVLDKKADKILVLSKDALDAQPYNTTRKNVTWETCTLRKWLNNDFMNEAFSQQEIGKIAVTTVSADKNETFSGANPGKATEERLFLLSNKEVNKYEKAGANVYMCRASLYASDMDDVQLCTWWLRTPGMHQEAASNVFFAFLYDAGTYVETMFCVRPAMWISIN